MTGDATNVATGSAEPVAAIDLFATALAGLQQAQPSAGFYGELCAAICRSVGLERAVVLEYDADLRRVKPQGSHGLEAGAFREVYVDPDTASFARDALEQDTVVELSGEALRAQTPASFQWLVEGRRVVCVPMTASGRWVGVVLGDRPDSTPPLTDAQREILWTLGKGVALAAIARRVTRKDERTKLLQQRIDLARDVHDGVVQHLFGVSLALEGSGPLPEEDRVRCAAEVQAALADLRSLVSAPLPAEPRPLMGSVAEEIARWSAAHADLEITLDAASPDDVPPGLNRLVHGVLSEALRNARKHGEPKRVFVRTKRRDGALVVDVENDGVPGATGNGTPGMGLRLAGIEALQAGGVLEFGPRGQDRWQVRLVVPISDD